ncbi:MAG TPA: twin-arginine translocase subunit TatC [Candidatus Acidoferrum sp.]|nr:twin-arginine translocase subunit TatC [Candidatus Acidoferrum sp.]
MSSESSSPFKNWALGFWGHMDELVRRFKVALVAFIVAVTVGWLPTSLAGLTNPFGGYQPLLSLVMLRVKAAFLPGQATLIAGGLGDTVYLMAYLSIIIGLLLASPVIFYEIVAFIKPALYANEKKVLGYYLGSFIGLLALGAFMAYFLIIPISFRILIYFTLQGGSVPFIFIKDFYGWIFTLFVLCGVFYTIPVFLVMLVHVGVLPIRFLKGRNKIIAYFVILMVFWIFGPDPTPVTGLIMLTPFVFVFETATFFARRIDRTRKMKKEAQASGTTFLAPSNIFKSACKHCNNPIDSASSFCPFCKRSIR